MLEVFYEALNFETLTESEAYGVSSPSALVRQFTTYSAQRHLCWRNLWDCEIQSRMAFFNVQKTRSHTFVTHILFDPIADRENACRFRWTTRPVVWRVVHDDL